MTVRRPRGRRPEWVQPLESRRLLANLGDLGIYLVDHSTHLPVDRPSVGQQVDIHATFVADSVAPGTVVRIQRQTANGVLSAELAAPPSWSGHTTVDRNLFTWTVPPRNAWLTVTLDPRNTVPESDESDNAQTLTLDPAPSTISLDVPAYHSLPGARYALYLDFDGNYQPSFAGSTDVTTPVFDTDANPASLSDSEKDQIRQIFARVAEDFAPFALDVTTELPQPGQYIRFQRVAIGGASCDWYEFSAAGAALVGSFADTDAASAAFAFVQQASADGSAATYPAPAIADAVSHEAGHTFGLLHQSLYDASGNLLSEYDPGHDGWGPVMGRTGNTISTWSVGPSTSPTTIQDDIAVIASPDNGFGLRADDVPDTFASAKDLGPLAPGGSLSTYGIIGTSTDTDVYSATLPAGTFRFSASAISDGPNLDAVLYLYNQDGTLLGSANPADSQSAFIDLSVPAGAYSLAVSSTVSYGRIGQYILSITPPLPPVTQPGPAPTPTQSTGPAPDLAVSSPKVLPRSVAPGTRTTLPVSLRNVGTARSTKPVTVTVYASPTRTLQSSFVRLGRTTLRSPLPAGNSTTLKIPLTYPKSLPAGKYFLITTARSATAERSAINNTSATKSPLKVAAPKPSPATLKIKRFPHHKPLLESPKNPLA